MKLSCTYSINFRRKCREFTAGLETAVGHLKEVVTQVPYDAIDKEAKTWVNSKIDNFIESRIIGAVEVISEKGANLIQNGDVIMTFSRSVSVEELFKKAYESRKSFKVMVVEGRPDRTSRAMIERLSKIGIKCVFTLIQSAIYVIKDVTKVLLGATAFMTNGTLLDRVGTSIVACLANSYHKPVIVCCETYKFSNSVQFDSLSHNILGNPDYLACSTIFTEVQVIG
jgi:translation initiation factor eIF-2B subunit delta